MAQFFSFLGVPLGFLLKLVYNVIPNYYIAIFLFVLILRILMFPLSLKTQKGQADRARLAPRLEELQKKYAKDPKKLQEKQQELYEKAGVSLTGGCLPMLVQMVVLFGIISVIYSPIQHITSIPNEVTNAAVEVLIEEGKVKENDTYYKELHMMQFMDDYEEIKDEKTGKVTVKYLYKDKIIANIDAKTECTAEEAAAYYDEIVDFKKQFNFFGENMLQNPWNEKGFAGINILWLIPILSALSQSLTSLLSMHYTKQTGGQAEQQQAQGCSNIMMLVMMPAMSLYIAFVVPGAVGIYWIFSSLIALLQTFILNQIYNPTKIREQAQKEFEDRRKQKVEDKKRLAEARAREQRELALQQNEEKKPAKGKGKPKAEKTEAVEDTAPEAEQTDEKTE